MIRVVELRNEVAIFHRERKNNLCEHFEDFSFILSLAYFSDIFSHLNTFNSSLQPELNVIDAKEKISSFFQKLILWKRQAETDNFANFSTSESIIMSNKGVDTPESLREDISDHFDKLQNTFKKQFPLEGLEIEVWIRDLFKFNFENMDDCDPDKEEPIDLKIKELYKQKFFEQTLDVFWCCQRGKQFFSFVVKTSFLKM